MDEVPFPRPPGMRLAGSLGDLAKLAREDDPQCGASRLGRPPTSGLYKEIAQRKEKVAEAIQLEAEAVIAAKIAEVTPFPLAERFAGPYLHKGDELGPLSNDSVEALVVHVGKAIGTLEEVRTKSMHLKGTFAGSMKVCEHNLRVAAEELARRLRTSGDPEWHEQQAILLRRELEKSRAETGVLQRRVAALESALRVTGIPAVGQIASPAEAGEGRDASGGSAMPASPVREPRTGCSFLPGAGRLRSGGQREAGTGGGASAAAAGSEKGLEARIAAAVAASISSLRDDLRRDVLQQWRREAGEVWEVVPGPPRPRGSQEGVAAAAAVTPGGSAVEGPTPMDVEARSGAAKRKATTDREERPTGTSKRRKAGEAAGVVAGRRRKKKSAPPPSSQTNAELAPRLKPAPPPPPQEEPYAVVAGRNAKNAARKKAAAANPPP